MYCIKCGQLLPNEAKFCFNCGNQISVNVLNTNDEVFAKATDIVVTDETMSLDSQEIVDDVISKAHFIGDDKKMHENRQNQPLNTIQEQPAVEQDVKIEKKTKYPIETDESLFGGTITIKKIAYSALFLAIALVLPFFTGQIKEIGNMLLPMHFPVVLCGLICGWQYGGVVGFCLPIVRSLLFGMPVLYPNAIGMAFELVTYGILCGLLYSKSHWQCIKSLYRCLIITMIGGRLVWGIAQTILLGLSEKSFSFAIFITNGFINAIPGLVLQFTLIPAIMLLLKKTHLLPKNKT